MEETLSFKRGSIDSDEEHIIWFTDLLHVPIHHSKESNCEIRKDAKRLSLGMGMGGGGRVSSQAAFGKLGGCLLEETRRGFEH